MTTPSFTEPWWDRPVDIPGIESADGSAITLELAWIIAGAVRVMTEQDIGQVLVTRSEKGMTHVWREGGVIRVHTEPAWRGPKGAG